MPAFATFGELLDGTLSDDLLSFEVNLILESVAILFAQFLVVRIQLAKIPEVEPFDPPIKYTDPVDRLDDFVGLMGDLLRHLSNVVPVRSRTLEFVS